MLDFDSEVRECFPFAEAGSIPGSSGKSPPWVSMKMRGEEVSSVSVTGYGSVVRRWDATEGCAMRAEE